MTAVESMIGLFEKAFGNYNPVLRKVLIDKICERGYDNKYDLPIITNLVFENYCGKWGKPPDWPEIKILIYADGRVFNTSCPVCHQSLSQHEKQTGVCNYCERQNQLALEPPISEADKKRFSEQLSDWKKRRREKIHG